MTTNVSRGAYEPVTDEARPITIFFDGECSMCNRWVDLVMKNDPAGTIRFGPKQGERFKEVAREFPAVVNVDSVVVVEREAGQERAFARTEAVYRVMRRLKNYRFLSGLLELIPRSLADLGYRVVSKTRYSIFGKLDTCRLPTKEERFRFLD